MPDLSLCLFEPDRHQRIVTVHMSLLDRQDLGYTRRRIIEFFEYTVPADLLERQLDGTEQKEALLRLQRGQSAVINLVAIKRQTQPSTPSTSVLESELRSREQCLLAVRDWLASRHPLRTYDADGYRRSLNEVEVDYRAKDDQVRTLQMALKEVETALAQFEIRCDRDESWGRAIVDHIAALIHDRDVAIESRENSQQKLEKTRDMLRVAQTENATLETAKAEAKAEITRLRQQLAECLAETGQTQSEAMEDESASPGPDVPLLARGRVPKGQL